MPELNWLAVLASAVMFLALGALWYSPALFYRSWLSAANLTEEQANGGNPGVVYGGAFLLALLAAAVFAAFLGPKPALAFAIGAGASAGIAWVAASLAIIYLFERRPARLAFINGGFFALAFTVMGAILGAWH